MQNHSWLGLNIHSSDLIPEKEPKLKLSSHINVSDKFRQEMDKWLLDTFGEQHVLYALDPKALGMFGNQIILMHPANVIKLNGIA